MKEKLYTLEVMDALNSGDECPCCFLERKLEQDTIRFVLGASYMEDDIRAETDAAGFCRHHTKMMYDYGNSLGNAWILKTRMELVRRRFEEQSGTSGSGASQPGGSKGRADGGKLFSKIRLPWKNDAAGAGSGHLGGTGRQSGTTYGWMKDSESTCYVCRKFEESYGRILNTFLHLMEAEPEFLTKLQGKKGFCLPHFADLYACCEQELKGDESARILAALNQNMAENLDRIQEDIDWFVDKFDYRNQDADWKTSKDAVQRTMQKLVGTHPADPVFQQK